MRYCNACGAETPEGARFCQNCGAELGAPVPTVHEGATSATMTPTMPNLPSSASTAQALPPYPPYPAPPYALVPGQGYWPRTNGKAIAGMWIGVASIPAIILNWVGIIIGIVGLVFSLIALSELRSSRANIAGPPQAGRTQATIGLLCSIVGIAASTAFLIYVLSNLDRFGIKLTT